MKQCTKCHELKPYSGFHKKSTAKDGFFKWCINCHRVITKTRFAERRKDSVFAEKETERVTAWRKNNPEKYKKSSQKYMQSNMPLLVAKAKKHYCDKRNRTPKWLSKDEIWVIQEAYKLATLRTKIFGFKWEVDHIIPLHGKLASGLHVPLNLQVIPMKINRSKSNKLLQE